MLRLFIFLTALVGTSTFSTDKKSNYELEQMKADVKTKQCKSLLNSK